MDTLNHIYKTSEYVYDKYSPMMFGIALQISSTEKEAEQILSSTFQKIHNQKVHEQSHSGLCVKRIKLTIETAFEQLPSRRKKTILS